MSDGLILSFDPRDITTAGDKMVRAYLAAGTRAVGTTTRNLEKRLEMATMQAVPGRLWRAWKSEVYPGGGRPAVEPEGIVFINGGNRNSRTAGAFHYWTQTGSVRRPDGGFYAVPLPAAGPQGRRRMLTPVEWEARHNMELRPVFRSGRAPILVADEAVLSGKAQVARPNTAKRIAKGRGSVTVPIFVLIPAIDLQGAISVDALYRQAVQELPEAFLRETANL
jgi:hypothetical protein